MLLAPEHPATLVRANLDAELQTNPNLSTRSLTSEEGMSLTAALLSCLLQYTPCGCMQQQQQSAQNCQLSLEQTELGHMEMLDCAPQVNNAIAAGDKPEAAGSQVVIEETRKKVSNESSAESCVCEEDGTLLLAAADSRDRVLEAIAAVKRGEEWEKVGKSGGADCFVNPGAQAQGHVGVMGRIKVKAPLETILRIVMDPLNKLEKRQTAELIKSFPRKETDSLNELSLRRIELQVPLM